MQPIPVYQIQEIMEMPTIFQGHSANLKVDTGEIRIWVSRMTRADGAPVNNEIIIEKLINGCWIAITDKYRYLS